MYAEPNCAHNQSAWSGELAAMGYDVPCREEYLASFTHQAVLTLTKDKRQHHSKAARGRMLAARGNKRRSCGDPGNTWGHVLQVDHPLSLTLFWRSQARI